MKLVDIITFGSPCQDMLMLAMNIILYIKRSE